MSTVIKLSNYIIKKTSNAEEVFKGLNGVFCVYKPAGESRIKTKQKILRNICRDMTELEVRPPESYVRIEGETDSKLTVNIEPSYADHPLVVGPRYQPEDFRIKEAHDMSTDMSGVLLLGLNKGCGLIKKIKESKPMRFFKVHGILGQATDNYFIDGKILEKSSYQHVKRHHLDMISASMQSSHQRKMFEVSGVHIQSQTAYELAVQGPIRPDDDRIPMVYSIKCIDFNPPEFTLEIVCINEDDLFIKSIIHALGIEARTTATCTKLQCFQYGVFNLNAALIKRDWTLANISDCILRSRRTLARHRYIFNQDDPILRDYFNQEPKNSNESLNNQK